MSLTGTPPVITLSVLGWDKFQHAGAYAVMTILFIRALRVDPQHERERSAIIVSIMLSVAIGALLEVLQGLLHNGREADLLDALANSVGALFAGSLYWFWQQRSIRRCLMGGLWLAISLSLPAAPAKAEEQNPLGSDAGDFFGALPETAMHMAMFPANQTVAGPWWTLAALGTAGLTFAYDGEIRRHFQKNRSSTLDHAADAGSLVGNPLVHAGLVSGIYAGGLLMEREDWRQTALRAAEALFLADAVTLVAKEAIGRARPDTGADKDHFRPFRFNGSADSLPSLHTASSFALATVLAHDTDSVGIAASYYLAATWVGASRIMQDHHWASDVVVGAVIGGLSGWSVLQEKATVGRQQLTVLPLPMEQGAGITVVGRWN